MIVLWSENAALLALATLQQENKAIQANTMEDFIQLLTADTTARWVFLSPPNTNGSNKEELIIFNEQMERVKDRVTLLVQSSVVNDWGKLGWTGRVLGYEIREFRDKVTELLSLNSVEA